MSAITIEGGRIIDPANGTDEVADLHIADGCIIALGAAPEGFAAQRAFDARGQIVCPGLVDLCARLGEPGHEQRGTIRSETRAAALAGVTSLVCPPDTNPVIDEPSVVELILNRAELAGYARVLPLGALTLDLKGERLSESSALTQQGCVGLGNADTPIRDIRVLRRAMEYAATFAIPIVLQPQDGWLAAGGCAHEGAVSTRLGLPGIPMAAETVAIAQLIELVALTGARLHLSRITSRRGVDMLRQAKRDGLPISADVSINHLHLSDIDISGFNSLCHVLPPLRERRDLQALREALADGMIDAVCSDHNPCESDAKMAPFQATYPGMSSIETLLPLLLRLADDGMDLSRCLSLATTMPANILGINAGTLSLGKPADICIFNRDHEWEVTRKALHSQGKNTPYEGWLMRGQVSATLIAGQFIAV